MTHNAQIVLAGTIRYFVFDLRFLKQETKLPTI